MDFDYFKMSMDSFKVFLESRGISYRMNPLVLKNEYFYKLKKYENQRFHEILQWLKDNYDLNRFPAIADFYKAAKMTSKPKYYQSPKREPIDRTAYSKDILAIAKKYTIPCDDKKVANKQKNLYRRKIKLNEVWSYKNNSWVDRTLMGNIGGGFLLPEDQM